jgi:glycosyltransferase involved in cell wall biosynthesis
MKICHVNLAKGFRGGERQTQLLIEALARLDVEQCLVARYDSPLHDKLAEIPNFTSFRVRKPYMAYLSSVEQYQPDLLHAHDAKAAQWSLLNYLLRRTPYLMTRRISRTSKNRMFTRAVYRNASKVVALSSAVRDSIHKLMPAIPVDVIPSMYASLAVDWEKVKQLSQRYSGYFVIGHIGALVNPHKGQAVLIRAMRLLNAKYTDMKVLLLGTGRDEGLLKRLASDLENVEFVGFVEDVGNWINVFDLFVFPSLEEGLGSSLLDVMQHAKPIVASGVGGILDVIQDGENGLLVPANQSVALAGAIEKMYLDKALRDRCAAAGFASIARYSPERVAQCYYDLYLSVLKTPADSGRAGQC